MNKFQQAMLVTNIFLQNSSNTMTRYSIFSIANRSKNAIMHFKTQRDKYHSLYNKIIEMQLENKKEVNSYIY